MGITFFPLLLLKPYCIKQHKAEKHDNIMRTLLGLSKSQKVKGYEPGTRFSKCKCSYFSTLWLSTSGFLSFYLENLDSSLIYICKIS